MFHPIVLDECRLEIPSRGIDAKLLVTTSNGILVNLPDFAGMEEPDYHVWTSKRGRAAKVAACSCKRLRSISGRIGKSLKDSRQGSRCCFLTMG